jgi:GTP cyclohydrolase I
MIVRTFVKAFLAQVGEDPEREGLKKTPQRVEDVLSFLTDGYQQDLPSIVNGAIFHEKVDDMVIIRDIDFFSLCEHHLLPFYGRCHIGYLPTGKILGLSKFPRIVEMYSRRLQLQERLTNQIAGAIQQILNPLGVAVVMEAAHLCMMMRGVEKQGSKTVTSAMLGDFRQDEKTRNEFLRLIEK